ncbi:MAG: ATP-binding protein, partial [Gammaproteobacteria bacterium]
DCQVPYETFDSILENLLQNAREKRIHEPGITISVSMSCKQSAGASMVSLKVCDSGSAISDEIKQPLFHEPLQSESGFGIGLYQSRQQAERNGYNLSLSENNPGKVCFMLENNFKTTG